MDASDFIRFAAALVFVLALIGAGAFGLRALGLTPQMGKLRIGSKRRLAVVETLHLDPKRRLAIVSRDGVEHLILLGAQSETVIEANIPLAEEDVPITEEQIRAEMANFAHLKADRWA